MLNDPRALFGALEAIHRRRAPFEACDTAALWDDDCVSARMLELHLDPESVPASRPHAFIARSATWISRRFDLSPGRRAGASVTGVDLSRRSIAYAKDAAAKAGLPIEYLGGDYLEVELPKALDLVTLIYCDLCALDPGRRSRLLRRVAFQYFTLERLTAELGDAGLEVVEAFGDVAGAPAAEGDEVIAVVARRARAS